MNRPPEEILSESFVCKLFQRFKMLKDGLYSPTEEQLDQIEPEASLISQPNDEDSADYGAKYDWQYKRIKPEDLGPFCEQLEKFFHYVRSIHELTYLTYDYPSLLQQRLEKDTQELQSLYLEVKAAVQNIDRIKAHRKAVKKDKTVLKKELKKIRDDEVREMETIVSIYDKPMYNRWESIKNSYKPEIFNIFLNDIKGKQEALDYLNTLVTRRLSQVEMFPSIMNKLDDSFGTDKPALANNTANSSTSVSTKRSGPRPATYRRRKYQDGGSSTSTRNFTNFGRSSASQAQQGNSTELSLVPLNQINTPFRFNLSNLSTTPVNTINSESDSSLSVLAGSYGSDDTAFSSNSNNPSCSGGNESDSNFEFPNEMRSVLQALFGELRQNTHRSSTTVNEELDGFPNNNTNIELFNIRRSNE